MAVSEVTAVVTTVAVAVVTKANTRAKRMKILHNDSPPISVLAFKQEVPRAGLSAKSATKFD